MNSAAASDPGSFLRLCIGSALLFFSFFMIGPLAPLYGARLGAPPATIGVIISAAYLLPFFLAIPIGQLVDRYGPKVMLIAGTMLLGTAPFVVVVAPGLASLVLVQVLAGLGQLLTVVAAQRFTAAMGVGKNRERNFGWYGAFVSGGQLLGPVVAGVCVDAFGFRVAFAVAGAVAFLALVWVASLRNLERDAARRPRRLPRPRQLAALFRLPSVLVSLLVSATVMIAITGHLSFLPAYLETLAYPATVIGGILSLRSLATVAVRPFTAAIVTRLGGRFRSFVTMMTLCALGVAGVALGGQAAVLVLASVLIGVGIGVAQPLTLAGVVEQAPEEEYGVAFGVRITGNRLVQFGAPLALGLIAQLAGYPVMFLTAGAITFGTVGVLLANASRFRAVETGEPGS